MKACQSGKLAYLSKCEADIHARDMKRKYKRKSYSYYCRFCNHWHLTTKQQYYVAPI